MKQLTQDAFILLILTNENHHSPRNFNGFFLCICAN